MFEEGLYYYPEVYGQLKDEDALFKEEDLQVVTEGEESEC